MLRRILEDMPFTLEQAIEKLHENNPQFKALSLSSIIINPTQREDADGDFFTVSHIRDADLYRLAEALEKNNTLEEIAIDGVGANCSMEWTNAGALALGESLSNHPKLTSVAIYMKTFLLSEKQIEGFLYCLTGSANIERFKLEIYCDTAHFLNTFGQLLLSKKKSLKSLHIQGSIHSKEEKYSLKDFATGLGAQKKLQYLRLDFLRIHDRDIAEIATAMQEVTSLKSIKLHSCKICHGVKHVCSIAKNNPELEELSLRDNDLREAGVKELVQWLPSFKKLKVLDLSCVQLNNAALDCLVTTYAEQKLSFPSLKLGANDADDRSIELIMRLIENNTRLKHLDLSFSDISDVHLEKMAPLLSDPTRCHLEYFDFGGNQPLSAKTYSNLLTILDKNEFLCRLSPPRLSPEHRTACDINQRKKQLRKWNWYIWTTICLFNAHSLKLNAQISKTNLSSMPLETLYLILTFVSPKTPHLQKESVVLCTDLIRDNLEIRRKLMDEKEYDPSKELKENSPKSRKELIAPWWTTAIKDSHNNTRVLFFPAHAVTPNLMKLPAILAELKPILSLVTPSVTGAEEQDILFNLSRFNQPKQIRIKELFARLLEIQYGGYHDIMDIPTADVNTKTGILTIKGISLATLKDQMARCLEPIVKKSSHCRVM